MFSFVEKYVWRDYGIFKIIFSVACILLLYEQLYTYLVLKPTLTQSGRRDLGVDDFPVMTFCPIKHVDMTKLSFYGYEDLTGYKLGVQMNGSRKSFGWSGKNGNASQTEVIRDISLLKSVHDCPYSNESFARFDDFTKTHLEFELTDALFPYHRCCKIIIPEESKSRVLNFVHVSIKKEEKLYSSYILYLSDQVTYTQFEPLGTRMSGKDITPLPTHFASAKLYKISLTEEKHLEENPNYECIGYKKPNKYNDCLEKYFLGRSSELLNCTPPYLTNIQVKTKLPNVLSDQKGRLKKMFSDIVHIGGGQERCCLYTM